MRITVKAIIVILVTGGIVSYYFFGRFVQPNYIIIIIDTLRADHLGCYGYPWSTSPNIDRLAKSGIQYCQAISQAPWTLPSVATMLTGRYPSNHGAGYHEKQAVLGSIPTVTEFFRNKGYATQAFVSIDNLLPQYGLNRGFDGYSFEPRTAEQTCEAGIEWVSRRKDKPFFLLLHFIDPHYPYSPPFLVIDTDDYERLREKKDYAWPKKPGAEHKEDMIKLYDGEIRYTDYFLGRFFEYLAKNKLIENSCVILTADHGEEFWDHGGTFHGNTMYDEQLMVPLIFGASIPVSRPSLVFTQVSLADIAPTLLALLRYPRQDGFDGVSLFKRSFLFHSAKETFSFSENIWQGEEIKSLRASNKKLLYHSEKDYFVFYNLDDDPGELKPLPDGGAEATVMIGQMKTVIERSGIDKTEPAELDDKTKERLKTLGYIQ